MALAPCLVQCITGAFEARANGHFASGLDNAGGSAQALGVVCAFGKEMLLHPATLLVQRR